MQVRRTRLILSGYEGEEFHVGDDVVVRIVDVFGNNRDKVRLAFEAPAGVEIDRKSVRLAKRAGERAER